MMRDLVGRPRDTLSESDWSRCLDWLHCNAETRPGSPIMSGFSEWVTVGFLDVDRLTWNGQQATERSPEGVRHTAVLAQGKLMIARPDDDFGYLCSVSDGRRIHARHSNCISSYLRAQEPDIYRYDCLLKLSYTT